MGETMTVGELRKQLSQVGVDWITLDGPWGFDLTEECIRREDRRFYEARVVQHPGGYPALAIVEEPLVSQPEDGSARVVGHVVVDVNPNGYVRTRTAQSLNGEILELKPSSVSKGELEKSGRQPDALFLANAQRLSGYIAVYRNDVAEMTDAEGLTPQDFVRNSTDARSITALAKLGLLS